MCFGESPKTVLPSVPIVTCATTGSVQTSRMAPMACSISERFDMVSRTNRSTPASRRAEAWSRKNSRASSSDVGP